MPMLEARKWILKKNKQNYLINVMIAWICTASGFTMLIISLSQEGSIAPIMLLSSVIMFIGAIVFEMLSKHFITQDKFEELIHKMSKRRKK